MATQTQNPLTPARKIVRVLVAEDSPLNLQVALMQLEKLGYPADAASDGLQVMKAVDRAPYDIILMDCQMPEMSGYEATWQIRNREKEAGEAEGKPPHVYIIAMTANTEADNREKCRDAGMDAFISKPVQLAELEAALHRALADRAWQRELDDVIDPVVVASIRQLRQPGKPDPLAALAELFFKEAPTQLDAIESALAKKDYASLSKTIGAASALKGSATTLGARGLAALCDELEQAAKTELLDDASPVLKRARMELERVKTALEKLKAQEGP